MGDVRDEGPVDLQRVDRETLEVRERRVPGAEVVDRDANAEVVQAYEHGLGACRIGDHHALGDLEHEVIARDARLPQHAGDGVAEARLVEGPNRYLFLYPQT